MIENRLRPSAIPTLMLIESKNDSLDLKERVVTQISGTEWGAHLIRTSQGPA